MELLTGERKLTREEARWLAAYRTMDDRGRRAYLAVVEGAAERWPRNRASHLQLIVGGKP